MIFDTLWTILLGVLGGVISSIIVSRVFLIQGEFQQEIKFVESCIRKLGVISGYLMAIKAVFEVSYDEDVHMEQEMKEKGYKNEMEYYAAHNDRDWISKSAVLETFKKEIKKNAETVQNDVQNIAIKDVCLQELIHDVLEYLKDIKSMKQMTFSQIKQYKKRNRIYLRNIIAADGCLENG